MATRDDKEIASLRARLSEFEAERSTLTERLKRLQSQAGAGSSLKSASASVNGGVESSEKKSRCFGAYLPVGRMYFLFVGNWPKYFASLTID
jgi:hypothetical protein